MSEWKEYNMSELIDEIAMGPFGSNIKVDCFVKKGVPVLNGSNLTGFKLSEKSFNYVTKEKAESLGKSNAKRGDIIVTHRGTLGQVSYIPDDSSYDSYVISQSQFRFSCKKDLVFVPYLVYYFHSREGQYKLLSNACQVGVPALARPTSTFKEISVILPPIEEQKRIAGVLSSLDDKIDLLNRENATLEALAETLFRHYFIENPNPTWKEGKLGDVAKIGIGRTPPRKETKWFSTSSLDVKWISIKDMGEQGVFIFNTTESLTNDAVETFKIPIIPPNTVVLSFKMTVGRIGITSEAMLSNEAIAHFILDDNSPISKEYLYIFLKLFKYETLGSTSSIVTSINSAMIKEMDLIIPDKDAMMLFNKQVRPLFEKIKTNQQQIISLSSQRDTLLPYLMYENMVK